MIASKVLMLQLPETVQYSDVACSFARVLIDDSMQVFRTIEWKSEQEQSKR